MGGKLIYEDFLHTFDKKYFPREALHQMKNAFEHLRQGTRTVRKYGLEFSLLCRFSGSAIDEEDLIMKFLDGMHAELCGRCSMVSYASLEDLVEKVVKDTCMAEELSSSR